MKQNQHGFTLVEMLVVLMIISTLLLITIPNIATNNQMVQEKGCEAMVKLAESQVQAYRIEYGQLPTTITELVENNYLEQDTCPGGDQLELLPDGSVQAVTTVQ